MFALYFYIQHILTGYLLCARISAGCSGKNRLINACSLKEFVINWKKMGHKNPMYSIKAHKNMYDQGQCDFRGRWNPWKFSFYNFKFFTQKRSTFFIQLDGQVSMYYVPREVKGESEEFWNGKDTYCSTITMCTDSIQSLLYEKRNCPHSKYYAFVV